LKSLALSNLPRDRGRHLPRLRWTITQAASEFPVAHNTLADRIRKGGFEPGEDGKWSTAQICAAIFGDLRGEQTRETKARADKLEIQNLKTLGLVLDKDVVQNFCTGFGMILRKEILASSMTEEEKDESLANIKALLDAGTITKSIGNGSNRNGAG
jgi:hypothetical protein